MRYLLIVLIFIFCLVTPGTVFYYLSPWGMRPDLMMLWIIYFSLYSTPRSAMLMAFGTGLLTDLYIGNAVGQSTFTLVTVAFICVKLQKGWERDNMLMVAALVFVVTIIGQVVVALLAALSGFGWTFATAAQGAMGVSLYNGVLVLLTHPLVHRSFTKGWLRKRDKYDLIN